MNAEQILRSANEAQPVIFAKTAEVMKSLEAEDAVIFKETVGEFGEIAGFASVETEKTASLKEIGVAATGGVLAALGTAVAMDLYDAAKRGLTKATNYKRVMQANPDLRKMDKGQVRSAFDTLHRFGGPEFTSDPMVSGAIVKHLAELPDLSPEAAMKLIQGRKGVVETKNREFSPRFPSSLPKKNDKDGKHDGGLHAE